MKLLFVHQNMPGQYRELVAWLAAYTDHQIVFLTQKKNPLKIKGVKTVVYNPFPRQRETEFGLSKTWEAATAAGIGAVRAAQKLEKEQGFRPDIVIGHAGWGELLFFKDLWKNAPVIGFFEFYYRMDGGLVGFDPSDPPSEDAPYFLRARNAVHCTTLDAVEVRANATDLLGVANTATEGTVLREQLEKRTVYRPGELLETVPGLIVTQHSGEGKANQYFLRGFNLDHGTDLRISVDGMLVNKRSHGHGQGWADTNFIIPELAGGIQYRKGPYYADQGDFSSAGSINTKYVNKLPEGILKYGIGQQGYMRGLLAKSHEVAGGDVLYAFELMKHNGPWTKKDKYNKFNAVLRYSKDLGRTKFHVMAMGYGGRWNATDQIPQRAVDSGLLSRLDTIDPSDGGEAHRYSLSAALEHASDYGITKVNLYTLHTNL